MELNKIYNEDCQTTMRRMMEEDVKSDLVLTSPPYNMTSRPGGKGNSRRYDVYKDWMSQEEYVQWTVDLFNDFDTILNDNRTVIYNFSYSIENPALPYILVSAIQNGTPFSLIDTIIWKKKSGIPFPANPGRLSRIWEFVFVFSRFTDIKRIENNRKVVKTSASGQNYYNVEYNLVEAKNSDSATPSLNQATFSTELCLKLMDIYCRDGWTVYDPFMGTGTTAAACMMRNSVNYIGSEISPAQCEYAEERLRQISKPLI